MSIIPTIPALFAQTGYTARVAHEAATAPQTAQSMARVMAEELLRQEQKQVPVVDNTDEPRIADRGGQENRQTPFGNRRRNRQQHTEDPSPSPAEAPLVGNLLNIKV